MKKIYLLAALFLAAFSQTFAQNPSAPPVADDEPIKIDSRLVVIPVSVTDANGQPVAGLQARDFQVSEENKPQQIEEVLPADKVPLEIAILFDISASSDSIFRFEQETAAQFLQNVMRPEDRAVIFTIGEKPIIVQPRETADKSAVSIKSIQPTKQFTAFYDTVAAAADYLENTAPQGRRKVIVVISDGEDTNSVRIARAINDGYTKLGSKLNTLDSKSLYQLTVQNRNAANAREQARVLQRLQNADTVFYSINPAGNAIKINKISQTGQKSLENFADETGGTAFLPVFQPVNTKDELQNNGNTRRNRETLELIFRQLANELRAQYLVQYYSEADFPLNKFVNINVKLSNPGNLHLRARQGYFVKKGD